MPDFPPQSAREEILNGQKIWVQTLNTTYRKSARNMANNAAAISIIDLRAGKTLHDGYYADFVEMGADGMLEFLINHYVRTGEPTELAITAHPIGSPPERTVETEDEFARIMERYETDKLAALDLRGIEFRTVCDRQMDKFKAIAVERLPEVCMNHFRQTQYAAMFNDTFRHYLIYHAVRKGEDHRLRFYDTIEEVMELTDEVRAFILQVYDELDTVRPADIPT